MNMVRQQPSAVQEMTLPTAGRLDHIPNFTENVIANFPIALFGYSHQMKVVRKDGMGCVPEGNQVRFRMMNLVLLESLLNAARQPSGGAHKLRCQIRVQFIRTR